MELCSSNHDEVCFNSAIYCPVCTKEEERSQQEEAHLDEVQTLNDRLDEKDGEIDDLQTKVEELTESKN